MVGNLQFAVDPVTPTAYSSPANGIPVGSAFFMTFTGGHGLKLDDQGDGNMAAVFDTLSSNSLKS